MLKRFLSALATGFEWIALVFELPSVLFMTVSLLFSKWAEDNNCEEGEEQ